MAAERRPSRPWTASRRLASVLARTMSRTDSACARSILPLRKALKVNSPGLASLAPQRKTSSRMRCKGAGPPWQSISTTSSLV